MFVEENRLIKKTTTSRWHSDWFIPDKCDISRLDPQHVACAEYCLEIPAFQTGFSRQIVMMTIGRKVRKEIPKTGPLSLESQKVKPDTKISLEI